MILMTAMALAAPRGMVVAGVGMPNLLFGRAEVFVAEAWSVEAGGGFGLLPGTVTVGARWTPERTCWGCWDGHGVRLSPGVTWYLAPTQIEEGLVTLNGELAWIWRSAGGWGTTVGSRLGLGQSYGQVADGLKVELGMDLTLLQLGVVF